MDKITRILKEPCSRLAKIERAITDNDNDGDNDQVDLGPDTLTFPFSSEQPVRQWFGDEVLSHDDGAIDLSRANGGMPYLWNHDFDTVLGVVESIEVKNQRGYCTIRWSNREDVEGFRQDVQDGILSNVSFMYQINSCVERNDQIVVTSWTPYEISLVSVPADPSVGVGRSLYKSKIEKNKRGKMEPDVSTPTINIDEERKQARDTELTRIRSIQNLGKQHRFPDLAEQLIEEGKSIEEAESLFLDKIANRGQTPLAGSFVQDVGTLGFGKKENREYSFCRAILAACDNDWSNAPFEREVHKELEKRSGRSSPGALIPVRDLKVNRSAPILAAGSPATGGDLIQTTVMTSDFIELLRNQALVMQMGARMMSGLQGNISIPGQNSASQAYWVSENQKGRKTAATFRQVPLAPKTLIAITEYTRQFLLQSTLDVEQFVREDFALVLALAIDLAAIAGTGLNNQPLGILNTAGIGSVALGINGAAPTYASVVSLMAAIESQNAAVGAMQWLANAVTKAKLMLTPTTPSGIEGNFILKDPGETLLGYKFNMSNQIPSNLTKGAGSNLSAFILGVWNQLVIAEWGILEILPNPFGSTYEEGGIAIRAMQSVDIAVRHPQSFAAITDMVTT